jgi:predicted DNA-binding transcriptional regulator AlpA
MGAEDESLATPKDVAEHLAVTEAHLAQQRYRGSGPRYIKVGGRSVRYRWSDVREWVEQQTRSRTW